MQALPPKCLHNDPVKCPLLGEAGLSETTQTNLHKYTVLFMERHSPQGNNRPIRVRYFKVRYLFSLFTLTYSL